MFEPRRVLRWIYIGRLSLATAIFVAAVTAWQAADAQATLIASLALVAALALTGASIAWQSRQPPRAPSTPFYYAQFVFDLALVTAVVHVTGGPLSQFVALYILITAGASLLLPTRGGLLVAALGTVLYAADALVVQHTALGVELILQLLVFATVSLAIAYLSARLKDAGVSREELEARLVLAKLQAEDILRNIRSGIVTIDARGRLLFANPTAGRLVGFDSDHVRGRPVREVFAAAPALAAALERAVHERERVVRGEATITRDGRTFPIGLTTTTIDVDPSPDGLSATVIFQDISDNKRLEALRLRTERLEAVAELSASLAHEIKNPLASIRSAVEQLARVPRATTDDRTLAALIVRESDRLSRLLSEFLDFARVRVTLDGRIDLGAVAQAAVALAAAHPDRKPGVRVTCTPPPRPLVVAGDEDLLHRAIFNIALNAVQAAPEDGEVSVEIAAIPAEQVPIGVPFHRHALALRIADDGPGISAEIRDRIFDPFFTTKSGGTGLGLPIVHRAIEAHRGYVFVDSSPGGTRFTVLLPEWQAEAAEAA